MKRKRRKGRTRAVIDGKGKRFEEVGGGEGSRSIGSLL